MSNIKAGDLVVVTKPTPCCGAKENLGVVFKVECVRIFSSECTFCGKQTGETNRAIKKTKNGGLAAYMISRLTRIDPLPDSETQDNHESLTA